MNKWKVNIKIRKVNIKIRQNSIKIYSMILYIYHMASRVTFKQWLFYYCSSDFINRQKNGKRLQFSVLFWLIPGSTEKNMTFISLVLIFLRLRGFVVAVMGTYLCKLLMLFNLAFYLKCKYNIIFAPRWQESSGV